MPDPTLICIAALILAIAAFVQSATGFGMALVCMAGLPLIMQVPEAVALVAVFNLLVTANVMWLNRSGFSWPKAWPLALAMVIGIPLGYFGFKSIDATLIIRILGGLLVTISLTDLRLSKRGPEKALQLPRWAAFPIGLGGGILGGAFNIGGPPIVAYVYYQNWSKAQAVAVLQSCFLAGGITRNLLMAGQGDYSKGLFVIVAAAIIPAAIAIWLGKRTLDRLPQSLLRKIVFIFVLLMGIKYLIWP